MAGGSLEVKLDDAQVQKYLERIRRRTEDLSPLTRLFGERMTKFSIPRNFREGGRPVKWKASKRAGREIKGRKGKTLIDTARLKNSITYRASRDEVRIGTNVVYARIHQLGGRVEGTFGVRAHERTIRMAFGKTISPRKVEVRAHSRHVDFTMPARPFLVVQPEDLAYLRKEIAAYCTEVGG